MNAREARAMRATGTAFEILYQPRAIADACTPPVGRGAKPGQSVKHVRKAVDSRGRAVVDLDPRSKNSITIGSGPTDADKTAKIIGRRNSARSE